MLCMQFLCCSALAAQGCHSSSYKAYGMLVGSLVQRAGLCVEDHYCSSWGLDKVLQAGQHMLNGITIDLDEWDPELDNHNE